MYFQFFNLDNNFHFMKAIFILCFYESRDIINRAFYRYDDGNVNFYILRRESFPRIKYAFKVDALVKYFREKQREKSWENGAREDL